MDKATDHHLVEQIDERLHTIWHVFDGAGRIVGTITTPLHMEKT